VIGFAVCGLGIANAVPLLFSAAGRLDPPGPSLAATFTIGYTGFIVGPPLIGLLSDRIGLPKTLGLLVLAALAVAALAGRATVSKPTMSSPDGELPTVVPEREVAIQ
jgi:MFS family permease